jgi:alpha-amylase/alpha-mannosidase (GH57 family)
MSSRTNCLQMVWHFHQPYYRIPDQRTAVMPWVRLHAIKSYYDMGRMLERFPQTHCTINFSGSLLKQLREYVEDSSTDSWWELSMKPATTLTEQEQQHLLMHFFSLNHEHCLNPYPRYRELLDKRDHFGGSFSIEDFRDLQVWFNLAWFGFSARSERAIVQELFHKGRGFTEIEKQALLEQQLDVMQLVVPLYRELHRKGQVELTVTPMYHPILPLLIDTESAGRATPERARPKRFAAPADAMRQVLDARDIGREFLGVDVNGMWPAEGAVSPEAVELFAECGVEWVASDEEILRNSRGPDWNKSADLYRPWRLSSNRKTAIFFRDRFLSDQIGFAYAKNPPEQSAQDFVSYVENVCNEQDQAVVSVILDGENPWEHYPNDGKDFLECLFERIGNSSTFETSTPSSLLENDDAAGTLRHLHSGSWIQANYATWIGHQEENQAWTLLADAHEAIHDSLGVEREGSKGGFICPTSETDELGWEPSTLLAEVTQVEDTSNTAFEALAIAQGSDWFWWFGDDFTSVNDGDFDRLFRGLLRCAYRSAGLCIPPEVDQPIISTGGDDVEFQNPSRLIRPRIDGNTDAFYEWAGAGVYRHSGHFGSMYASTSYVTRIHVGFDLQNLYFRIAPSETMQDRIESVLIRISLITDRETYQIELEPSHGGTGTLHALSVGKALATDLDLVAFGECIDTAIPFATLHMAAETPFSFVLHVEADGIERERHPVHGSLSLIVPDSNFEMRNWLV